MRFPRPWRLLIAPAALLALAPGALASAFGGPTELPGPHTDRRTGKVHDSHLAKVNAAHAEGGSALAVETVEALTGLDVHRYLEIDFRRFMDTVDRVDDGVPVCTAKPLKDSATGLDLAAGTTRLGGGEGLQYVRSRKADGEMDFGRMRKQQKFLVNTLDRIRSGGILKDPARLRALASTLRGTAAAERGISTSELLTLATRLKALGPSRTELATVPVRGFDTVEGVGSTVGWDEEGAAEVFARLRADRPLPPGDAVAPSELSVADYEPARGASLICP